MPRKKAAPAAPELEALEDTLSPDLEHMENFDAPEPVKRTRTRQAKQGPKRVLGETTKVIGDGLAVGILLATTQPDKRKNLSMEEAQSIGHPTVRIMARRVPGWIKPFLPKTKLDAEDAADLEEILVTMGKVAMRLVMIAVNDFVTMKERSQAARQQQRVATNAPAAPAVADVDMPAAPAPAAPAAPHNPAFDIFAPDLGIEA